MKLQYLGDVKDSFKWDYHDYLVSELKYPLFNIAFMLTPDDSSSDGKLDPSGFKARTEIINFCHEIRQERSLAAVKRLSEKAEASYRIGFHKGDTHFDNGSRVEYFSGIDRSDNQVFFLNPDNGFEPEKSCNEKHVRYTDITRILEQLPEKSVVSVFQHQRRISFPDDFARINERIETGYSTAIYWHSLMFMAISKSETVIKRVISANSKYAERNLVKVIV